MSAGRDRDHADGARSALASEAPKHSEVAWAMMESLDNQDRQAVADLFRQHMAADVRELIATAALVQARRDGGEPPDELSARRLRNARANLLESAQLGMAQGLSRLEVHRSILAAARGEAMTQEVRLALYEVIEEIGPD